MNILNIPNHKNCRNCGECCGVIPITKTELEQIKQYVRKYNIRGLRGKGVTCPFRDESKKRCAIYAVRPIVCRLMGITKGMNCPNGNTCEMNGDKFVPREHFVILNDYEWR